MSTDVLFSEGSLSLERALVPGPRRVHALGETRDQHSELRRLGHDLMVLEASTSHDPVVAYRIASLKLRFNACKATMRPLAARI